MAALGTNAAVAQAFTRFGLGGRPDDLLPSDPVAWLEEQITAPDPTPVAGMPTLSQCLALVSAWQNAPAGSAANIAARGQIIQLFAQEAQDLLANSVLTQAPFRERLVWFWANHFAIMAGTIPVLATAGSFVRDAIRPHVTGFLSDMLLAVMQHPAMLYSLDNTTSAGPQSQMAQTRNQRGLPPANINENLGRETLELYTVGVNANYSQPDVDALAYLLTGWTVNTQSSPLGFYYEPYMAQPGSQTLMGATYPNTQAGCTSAFKALATNPYTYQHLATKLVTHFVSDTPTEADVFLVYNVLASTGGNLATAAQALVSLPNAWTPLTKLRTPQELVVAALRAAGTTAANVPALLSLMTNIGQPTWQPPFPNGWSDLAADWTGPEAMLLRADCIGWLCNAMPALTPSVVASNALGPLLSANTAAVVAGAGSIHDQLTVLLCSPEFQRR